MTRKNFHFPSHNNILEFENNQWLTYLVGPYNRNLKHLEDSLNIHIALKGNILKLEGHPKDVLQGERILLELYKKVQKTQDVTNEDVEAQLKFHGIFSHHKKKEKSDLSETSSDIAYPSSIVFKNKIITARSPNQDAYIQALRSYDMVFGLGPAGTGKTYLAVAMGVSLLLSGHVERLIFSRPALEAGERLGFLPGDLKEKIDPYLRPIYDALYDFLPPDHIERRIANKEIEIAPLAFMRGRTLSNAFVLLDEAQNATCLQMKMALTRLGRNSRMIITGDLQQSDLPQSEKSGLKDALDRLKDIPEVAIARLSKEDVMRHALVQKILGAYEKG